MIAIIIISSVLLLLSVILLISYITYRMAFQRAKREIDVYDGLDKPSAEVYREKSKALIDSLCAREFEEVYMTSRDGLRLCARYYHANDNAPLEIQCHGYRSTPLRDFSGGATETIAAGRNLLLIYQRSHCKSEGKTITFGLKESLDLVDWTRLFLNRLGKNTPVVYTGISMGAATVLMACRLKLPENVKCIIADCPYSSAKEIIQSVIRSMKLPPRLAYPFVRLGAVIFGGFDPDKCSVVEAVRHARVPILLIHGEEDRFVPAEMSERIHKACGTSCRRITFPEARHGTSYLIDTEGYMKNVREFLRECGIK